MTEQFPESAEHPRPKRPRGCSLMQEKLYELHQKHFRQPLWETLFFTNTEYEGKNVPEVFKPRADLLPDVVRCKECGKTIAEHSAGGPVSGVVPVSFTVYSVEGDDAQQSQRRDVLIRELTRFGVALLECVESAPNWDSAAELALFVASAKRHNVDLNGLTAKQISDKLATLRQAGKNETFLELAVSRGFFDVERFVPAHKNNVVEAIANKRVGFNRNIHIVYLDDAPGTSRHVETPSLIPDQAVMDAVSNKRLPILVGYSGSGKTATMIATAYSMSCSVSPLYVALTSTKTETRETLKTIESMSDTAKRDESVAELLLKLVKKVFEYAITTDCDATVALVIDEIGEYPNFLRGLCALYKKNADGTLICEPLQAVKAFLRCKDILLFAGGTGCDIAETSVGSANNSYAIVRMDDKRGADFLDMMLEDLTVSPRLKAMLANNSNLWVGQYVREALLNRRVAALFLQQANNKAWDECDWNRIAPVLLIQATMLYKEKNGLQLLSFSQMTLIFAQALATSLGGNNQKIDDKLLSTKYGLIVDLAKVDSGTVTTQGLRHRYGMSVAVVRMFLTLLFGIAPRPRSGDGFEQTVADFAVVQVLAGMSGVEIAPLGKDYKDPLESLKASLRSHGKGAQVVASLTLDTDAKNADEALERTRECLERRLSFDKREWTNVPFAAVVRNCDKAPAADLFVVSGTLLRDDGRWSLKPRDATAPSGVSLQVKHYSKVVLTEYEARAEFFKMGSRTSHDCKGVIAAMASVTDLSSKEAFDAFQVKQIGKAAFTLPKSPMEYTGERNVKREDLFRDLSGASSSLAAPANGLFLVALFGDSNQPTWQDSRVAFLTPAEANDYLEPIPVRRMPVSAAQSDSTPSLLEDVTYAHLVSSR